MSAEHFRVADVMARDVEFIEPQESVQAAAVLMGEIEVGAQPVGSSDQLIGIVTDRDLLYRVVARGRDPTAVSVQEAAPRPFLSCNPGNTFRMPLDVMGANYVRRLSALGGNRRVVGWLTFAGISRHLFVNDDALQMSLQVLTEGVTEG